MFPGPLRGDQLWEVVPATGGVGQVAWEVAPWFGDVVPATGGMGQVVWEVAPWFGEVVPATGGVRPSGLGSGP